MSAAAIRSLVPIRGVSAKALRLLQEAKCRCDKSSISRDEPIPFLMSSVCLCPCAMRASVLSSAGVDL